jgi:hypothetical protein
MSYVGYGSSILANLSPAAVHGWPGGLGLHRLRYSVQYATIARKEIEDLRAGGDLVFKLKLLYESQGDAGPERGSAEIQYNVNKSAWIECMKQFGLDRIVLLEIALPPERGALATAANLLAKARAELDAGNFDGVVQKCRLAIESVQEDVGATTAHSGRSRGLRWRQDEDVEAGSRPRGARGRSPLRTPRPPRGRGWANFRLRSTGRRVHARAGERGGVQRVGDLNRRRLKTALA